MSLINLNNLKKENRVKAKVCIVGTGPGGGVLAKDLVRRGIDVVMLEKGNLDYNSKIDDQLNRVSLEDSFISNYGFSSQLGGSSNLWAGRVAKFDPEDFKRADRNFIGWPIEISELDHYYNKSLDILGLKHDFKKINVNDKYFLKIFKLKGIKFIPFKWVTPTFRVSDYLCKDEDKSIQGQGSVSIYINSNTVSINKSKNKILSVTGKSSNGNQIIVESEVFVIAAGGIESARLLLNSKIGNEFDNVGRFLSTHPKADIGTIRLKKPIRTSNSLFSSRKIDGEYYRYGIGLTDIAQKESQSLNHYIQLSQGIEVKTQNIFDWFQKSIFLINLINKYPRIGNLINNLGLMSFSIIGKISRLVPYSKNFTIRIFLDQHPHPDNRVFLSNEVDNYGVQKVDIKWKFYDNDKESVVNFFNRIIKNFRNIDNSFTSLIEQDKWKVTGIHSHFMGTTRMSKSPESGVVDKNCKVHNVDNLYISGPSVFPSYGYANPFLTIMTLALRLSKRLSNVLDSHQD